MFDNSVVDYYVLGHFVVMHFMLQLIL